MFLNFFFAFCIVNADVIREDGYHDYEGQFTVVHKGRMLRILMFFHNVRQEVCALHCVRHLRCRTINYNYAKKDCELTDEDFNEMNVDTITPGWHNYGTPTKVNGGWSSWRDYTDCTKTCEGGTVKQWRDCNSPKPEYGGAECKGIRRRTAECNTHGCTVENAALNRVASQSSTYAADKPRYLPSNAVDGSSATSSCTLERSNEWWEVDLGKIRVIKYIRLNAHVIGKGNPYNQGLIVETRRSKKDTWILCHNMGDVKVEDTNFECKEKSTVAQYFRIRSTKRCYVYFREIMVFCYKND